MPTLNWIGKKAVENHHRQVPFRLLKDVPELSVGDPGTGNLIIEGDNLLALKALLPYYAGQVKCIYIDPPYNTGNESWVYNDNANSPEMRDWLGKVVGREADDLCRHDKWLCMMYPRLAVLHKMLNDGGAVFVSIDDVELGTLRLLMDEVFGSKNFICTFVWEKKHTRANDAKYVSDNHDFILCYAKNIEALKLNRLPRSEEANSRFNNPDNDSRGPWISQPLQVKTPSEAYIYEITTPSGRKVLPPAGRSWAFDAERYKELVQDNKIYFGSKGTNVPRMKKFLSEVGDLIPLTIWYREEVGDNQEAKTEVKEVLNSKTISFDSPKPVRLIERVLEIASDKNAIILDSFSGSGTTAHAVMHLNKQDGGNRKFILVEMDQSIARSITAERVKRVVFGYKNSKGESVEGLGGGFRYCQLGDPLFDEKGNIRNTVRFHDLARHVFFTETGEPLPREAKANSPLIGLYNGTAIYLLYNGILKDKAPDGGNVLTTAILAHLSKHSGPKVIYGTACRIGQARLNQENIIFKQLPYKLKVDAL